MAVIADSGKFNRPRITPPCSRRHREKSRRETGTCQGRTDISHELQLTQSLKLTYAVCVLVLCDILVLINVVHTIIFALQKKLDSVMVRQEDIYKIQAVIGSLFAYLVLFYVEFLKLLLVFSYNLLTVDIFGDCFIFSVFSHSVVIIIEGDIRYKLFSVVRLNFCATCAMSRIRCLLSW